MIKLLRTNSKNLDFIDLVKHLDADLAQRDGDDHAFYSQFNSTQNLDQVVVAYEDDLPAGCGAIKHFEQNKMEIKRMFVSPRFRGKRIASQLLEELESWATELSCSHCLLETGQRQPEAIRLYGKNGYVSIPKYGPYVNVENSLCFEKKLGSI